MSEHTYTQSDLAALGKRWLERIRASEKREEDWSDDAEKAESAFSCDRTSDDLPWFNIVHSNVETIVPAIYNSSPKPDVRPRHNNKDDLAKTAADALERALSTQIDDGRLDGEIEDTAQDTFLTGRGVTRIRFDADEVPAVTEATPFIGDERADIWAVYNDYVEGTELPDGLEVEYRDMEVEPARVENERVVFENVSWRDYREGPGKRWSDIPWVCFRHEISEIERERLENPDIVSLQKIEEESAEEEEDQTVWEIWDKDNRVVIFIVEESETVLDIMDDPLGLPEFFPLPEPVQPIGKTGKRTPVCPYSVYEKLADELNLATRRINAIMKGLKVRGLAAVAADTIAELAQAGDNELVTSGNTESLVAMGGLERAVMWWPIETAIQVLRELYAQRDQIRQSIYEITGISDIVRGASNAQETATAQGIKAQWGSLRIKKMQRLLERHIRELFVMSVDIMARHFSDRQISMAAGMDLEPTALQLIRDAFVHYLIDIETDSTVRADLTKSRAEMSEFLQGSAQYFQTMGPLIESAPGAAGPAVEMYAAFARQFNLGKDAEDALEALAEMAKQAGQQQQGNPEADAKMAEVQAKMQLEFQKLQLEVGKLQLQMQEKQLDVSIKREELGLKRDELGLKEASAEVDAAVKFAEVGIEREQERPAAIGS